MSQPNPSNPEPGALEPAALVRTEPLLLKLWPRAWKGRCGPFARAVELILSCGQGNGRVVLTGWARAGLLRKDCGDAQLDW